MDHKPSIQFISRAYPPMIGGIENQNKAIHDNLSKYYTVKTIINHYGKKVLALFLPYATLKALFNTTHSMTLLGDGVLAFIPWVVRKIRLNKKFICIVHGLDVTYPSKIYQQFWLKTFFKSVDHFIAVSQNTKQLLIKKGINSDKISVIANGFDFSSVHFHPDRNKINALLNDKTENKILLLTLGRLVKRKGVQWFIKNVISNLDSSILYVVAGSGPETDKIEKLIKKMNLSQQVKLLGQVSQYEKEVLLSNCDLFIQPNIKIKDDVEGFGISVIEASAYNLPVLASNLEGLKDAIHEEKNGWLIESENKIAYINKIQKILENPEKLTEFGIIFKKYSQSQFDWDHIIHQYIKVIKT